MQRRSLLQASAALGLLTLGGCATSPVPTKARVVVVGGGWGGATAAKYVRLLSGNTIDVVLVEPNASFVDQNRKPRLPPSSCCMLSGGSFGPFWNAERLTE